MGDETAQIDLNRNPTLIGVTRSLQEIRKVRTDDNGKLLVVSTPDVPPAQVGVFGYNAGVLGTVVLTGGKRVLQITAITQGGAASLQINGGDTIPLPYNGTDKTASSIDIVPMGNLVDPTIDFNSTVGYFVEWVV